MATLTKDIFQSMKEELFGVQCERIEIAEGYEVNVVQLTAEGALSLTEMSTGEVHRAMFAWAAACVVDDDWNPIFSVDDLGKLPQAVCSKLLEATARLNGLLRESVIEDAEKNSEEADS